MARLKRILKRWPGIFALVWFTIVYSFGQAPIVVLGMIKQPSLTVQIILTIVGVLTLAIAAWFIWQYYQKWPPVKRYFSKPQHPVIFMVIMVAIVAVGQAIPTGTSDNQATLEQLMRNAPVGMTLMAVIGAPICEELLFRGIFFRRFLPTISSWQTGVIGILISALLFGSLHASLLSFTIIPYIAMGIAFAMTYLAFDDLRYDIGLHMLNNLIAAVTFFMSIH
ncbi:CAAX protease [Lactobacillus paraplantarum] [Lactiplantibacillus mudanjiangensis]|uniref:CPBP family intramembrane glutamic endopeptidase n=1 Tax=Lactiplantibacillus mudanjiangensis TaxID=1296538 RepID=UPI0010156966|nr:CAAX protease [Lactobacillus paraplantarum] [Lactiplantibacillus mudanjiangensis]